MANSYPFITQINPKLEEYMKTNSSGIKINWLTQQDEALLIKFIEANEMPQLESILTFQRRIANHKWINMIYMFYVKQLETNKEEVLKSLTIDENLFQLLAHQLVGEDFNLEIFELIKSQEIKSRKLSYWINPLCIEGKLIIQWLLTQDFPINAKINAFFNIHIKHNFRNALESTIDWIDFLRKLYEDYGKVDYYDEFMSEYHFKSRKELERLDVLCQKNLIFSYYTPLTSLLAKYFPSNLVNKYKSVVKNAFVKSYCKDELFTQAYLAWLYNINFEEAISQNKLANILYLDRFETSLATKLMCKALVDRSYDWSKYIDQSIPKLINHVNKGEEISLILFMMVISNPVKMESFVKQWQKINRIKPQELRCNETYSLKKLNICKLSLEELFDSSEQDIYYYIEKTYSKINFPNAPINQNEFKEFSEFCLKIKTQIETVDHSDETLQSKLQQLNEIYKTVVNFQSKFPDIEVYDSLIRNVQKYIIIYENLVEKQQIDSTATLLKQEYQLSQKDYFIYRLNNEYELLCKVVLEVIEKNLVEFITPYFKSNIQLLFKDSQGFELWNEACSMVKHPSQVIDKNSDFLNQLPQRLLLNLFDLIKEEYLLQYLQNYFPKISLKDFQNIHKLIIELEEYCQNNGDLTVFNYSNYQFTSLYEITIKIKELLNLSWVIEVFTDSLRLCFRKLEKFNVANQLGFDSGWQEKLELKRGCNALK